MKKNIIPILIGAGLGLGVSLVCDYFKIPKNIFTYIIGLIIFIFISIRFLL